MPAKGMVCHVFNKGLDQRIIFNDDADYAVFLGYLKDYLTPPGDAETTKKEFTVNGKLFRGTPHLPKNYFGKVELNAYSLEPSSYQLLLHELTPKSLEGFIRSLSTRYSIYFNKKYARSGSLFQGPYKSVQIKDDAELVTLVHSFHNTGVVSSHSEYLGTRSTSWVHTKEILNTLKSFPAVPLAREDLTSSEKTVKRPAQTAYEPVLTNPQFLMISFGIFIVLFFFGFRHIQATSKVETAPPIAVRSTPPPTAVLSADTTNTPSPKIMVIVKLTGTASSVNIFKKPGTEVIAETHEGDTFEFVSINSGWYGIKLADGSTGYIWSGNVETEDVSK